MYERKTGRHVPHSGETIMPRFKSLQAIVRDYFADGADGHVCGVDEVIPQYFYYQGK